MKQSLAQLLKKWEEEAGEKTPERILLQILQDSPVVQDQEPQKIEEDISPFIYPH
jgi:hypothetical protein